MKLRNLALAVAITLTLALTGCGDMDDTGSFSSQSENYSYEFSFNGCNTGEHSFSSLNAMCDGLENSVLNGFCAESLRRDYFRESGCPGLFL